jgi:hypothetical protein
MARKIKPFELLLSLGLVASLSTACGGGATDEGGVGTEGTDTPGSVEEAPGTGSTTAPDATTPDSSGTTAPGTNSKTTPDTSGTTTMPDTSGTTTAPGTNSTTTPDTTITDPVTPDPATPGVGGSN